jgi:hypothetical protein
MASKLRKRSILETAMVFACAEVFSTTSGSRCKVSFRELLTGFRDHSRRFVELKGISDEHKTFVYSPVAGPEGFRIVDGVCITRDVEFLRQKNKHTIQGIIRDAPWKVLYAYVCWIMMLSIRSVGDSIAPSSGRVKDTDLHDSIFITFMEVCSIHLREHNVPIVSD